MKYKRDSIFVGLCLMNVVDFFELFSRMIAREINDYLTRVMSMVSQAERNVSRSLNSILAELPLGASIVWQNRDGTFPEDQNILFVCLEIYIPQILQRTYPEWWNDTLDGISALYARKSGEREADIYGLCTLMNDQTYVPIHIRLQVSPSADQVSWIECKLGERGKQGLSKQHHLSMELPFWLNALDGRHDQIDWAYRVSIGERNSEIH